MKTATGYAVTAPLSVEAGAADVAARPAWRIASELERRRAAGESVPDVWPLLAALKAQDWTCEEIGAPANCSGSRVSTVLNEHDVDCGPAGRRVGSPPATDKERMEREEAAALGRRVVELYYGPDEPSFAAIARKLGPCERTIRNRFLAAGGVPRPQGRRRTREERRCELCGEPFPGDGRFCSRKCEVASGAHAEVARAGGRATAALVAAELAAAKGERLVATEVAKEFGVEHLTVLKYVRKGLLAAEGVHVAGKLHYLFEPDEVERFRKDWRRGGDGRRQQWLDEDHVVKVWRVEGWLARFAEREGLTEEEAERRVREAVRRRRKLLPAPVGRKKATGPPEHYLRWKAMVEEVKRELDRDYRERAELDLLDEDERQPTHWDVCRAVAQRDWVEHPEDWPRDRYPHAPGDPDSLDPRFVRTAANRVAQALARLP